MSESDSTFVPDAAACLELYVLADSSSGLKQALRACVCVCVRVRVCVHVHVCLRILFILTYLAFYRLYSVHHTARLFTVNNLVYICRMMKRVMITTMVSSII